MLRGVGCFSLYKEFLYIRKHIAHAGFNKNLKLLISKGNYHETHFSTYSSKAQAYSRLPCSHGN
ncbi:hypothetical protein THF5H11_120042 [Vibrio jasicida]|uniref:Uncharacterized protein n=1 Tax=Vibrio jasicida TaxID=766224 RepID=A0AAU9QPH1_9VIBR|nr:hypothetical protein THF5H11_120042 [Vibrio jasicida]CAH1584653.1 hypothetical protein THF1C08_260063 [Vibrio jasicida]CAH1596738.1 hypothetical protein THF1A12_300048 [Vibrio jasicida]CAH1605760.1 hypothetical protein THF5G08_170058 [Vibrio jasicida]